MSQNITVESEIKNLLKTGKVVIGSRRTLKKLKMGKLKAVIVVSTLRGDIMDDIVHYCKVSGIPFYKYPGSGWDLGTLVGKPFMISTIGVEEPGNSRILELLTQQQTG
ncbi:MAG: 50S ribosomal protein L30e [Candidatus Aramenus sulfurataquae]|jgi:large subunit ribosomal protein L30e|uniref:Large ribosomal subunit protein eL30 n=2 Tax=Candidatus Aramenus sulfurataquae TaxID=1326980 RepID=W7L6E6_9CREN|nr:MAG: 50S ribosomal protein L30e [Candidatus Aramenus sulfurataquae]MCL7343421.1 50S ribosomal protein L30e [Candidatus Aramenus sulfurataquae]